MKKMGIVVAACAALVCGTVVAAEAKASAAATKGTVVRKLGKEDAALFVGLAARRTARFDELAVFQRVLREKRAELKDTLAELQQKFGLDPKKSYFYESATRKLFELTPAKAAGAEPAKKEVKAFKDAKDAAPLTRSMVARKIVENQIEVLGQLSREKAREAEIADARLRKVFKLDADGLYSFDADAATIYKTGVKAKPAAAPAKAAPKK